MQRFKLTIETVNAAFEEPGPELARILRDLADKLEDRRDPEDIADGGSLRDINGNRVGTYHGE